MKTLFVVTAGWLLCNVIIGIVSGVASGGWQVWSNSRIIFIQVSCGERSGGRPPTAMFLFFMRGTYRCSTCIFSKLRCPVPSGP